MAHRLFAWLLVCRALVGCVSGNAEARAVDEVVETRPERPDGVGDVSMAAPAMTDEQRFEAARSAFRAYAERTLDIGAATLEISPSSLKGAERQLKVGSAWAMQAFSGDARLRGWALPTGEVATVDHNLGILLEAAGLWDGTGKAHEIAKGLVWGLKWGHQLYVSAAQGAPGPKLEIDTEGRGALVFYTSWRNPQPTGPTMPGAKEDLFRHKLTLLGRAKAVHSEEPWRP